MVGDLTVPSILAPPDQHVDGSYAGNVDVYGGSSTPTAAALTGAENCSDWTDGSANGSVYAGLDVYGDGRFFYEAGASGPLCSAGFAVYCLEP